MLKALGIENQVISMTTDTAANMKTGVIVHMSPKIKWLGCGCHKTELTVQKFVNTPGLKETLKRFSKVAGHLHKSTLSLGAFFEAQKVSLQVLLTLSHRDCIAAVLPLAAHSCTVANVQTQTLASGCRFLIDLCSLWCFVLPLIPVLPQQLRFPNKKPVRIPTGCVTRWWSWMSMLAVSLEHKSSVLHTIELANERSRVDIVLQDADWTNAASMVRMLRPFASAVETMEGDYLGLAEVPCIMNVLNDHIEKESAAFTSGPFHVAGQEMLLDHDDRWETIPDVMKMASALSARTKGLEWLSEAEQKQWRDLLVEELKVLFRQDIAAEIAADSSSAGGGSSGGDASDGAVDLSGSEPPKKQQRLNFRTMAVMASRGRGSGGAGQTQQT